MRPIVLCLILLAASAQAAEDDRDARIRRLEQTVQDLQKALGQVQFQLKEMKTQEVPKPPASGGGDLLGGAATSEWGVRKSSGGGAFPFDLGVVGDVTGRLSFEGPQGERPSDRFSFREADTQLGEPDVIWRQRDRF